MDPNKQDLLLLSKYMNNYNAFNISEHVRDVQRQSNYQLVLTEIDREFQRPTYSIKPHTEQISLIQMLIFPFSQTQKLNNK